MLLPSHGSNPHYLYQSLQITQPEKIIDFSANINPLGPPPELKERWPDFFDLVNEYPDPRAGMLVNLISKSEELPEDRILVGNGGAELITLVARFLSGRKVLIIQPAFSEYEQACMSSGCRVTYHILEEGDWELRLEPLVPLLEQVDAVFICTPNNPTGVAFKEQSVLKLIKACQKHGVFTIIDEAFHDFLERDFSYASYIKDYSNLLILRSLTKMYAIPGLRLGYLLANPEIISQIKRYRPHWSVNSLALMAGEISLKDKVHVEKTKNLIRQQRYKLNGFYKNNNFIVSDSQVNFYLVRDSKKSDQLPLLRFLLQNGIVPRHTFNFPGLDGKWLRFAVKSERDNERLVEVFRQWRNHH
ncbi:threonine-phosphate decarboxylase [Peribacillus cavernae]|uniref:threonine-phosphate decarboxylase n=1 Tax=Peribacillus cavernae TaxID=1674310 RepID=A0A3S0U0J1_9BACI|nr:threonine-phosphate decarboxylase CobD [Peribacillus cavernae]MDQ0218593.1 threonine-phosphate decarboxylase [Peribacillus cavernae]RUQ31580.1 threonine-phosphate decarboxylase [Peribacillus cavernae]